MSFIGSPNNPGSSSGGAGGVCGLAAARPAAATLKNQFYFATDTGEVTFSDGTSWFALKGTSNTGWQAGIGAGGNFPVIAFVNASRTDIGNQNVNNAISTSNGDVLLPNGNLDIQSVGKGLRVAEGANAKQGVATLVAGTVTVANTSVTANSRIFLTPQDNNTSSFLKVSARVVGASFTITSGSASDTGNVAWLMCEPG